MDAFTIVFMMFSILAIVRASSAEDKVKKLEKRIEELEKSN